MIKLSVFILTFNEERNIARCINSFKSIADEILIIDSFSTDDTIQIAQNLGAITYQQSFKGFISQRQLGIEQCKHDYILALDADEYLSEELLLYIKNVKSNWKGAGYKLNRLGSVGGIWIKHGDWFPNHILRLFDRTKVKVGGLEPHDSIQSIDSHLTTKIDAVLYHDSDESIASRSLTIDKYSTIAAQSLYDIHIKGNLIRMIIKPSFRFIKEYLFLRGFLDGKLGYQLARMSAKYVYLREKKLIQLNQ